MPKDNRTSQRVTSDTTTISGGDSTTNTVVGLNDEQTLAIGYLKVEYAGSASAETVVEVYDEDEATTSGNLSDVIDSFILNPGDRVILEEPFYSEIEHDLVAAGDGNSDGAVKVTAGGPLITG